VLADEKEKYSLNERMFFSLVKFKDTTTYSVATLVAIAILVAVALLSLELQKIIGQDVIMALLTYTILAIAAIYGYRLDLRRKEIHKILDDYVRQCYYFSFETLKPEGKDSLEKFMSLAKDVFPSIKYKMEKLSKKGMDWKSESTKKSDGYSFDISLDTNEGVFLLKHFTSEVKFTDVEEMVKNAGGKILRVVCLANKFENMFFTEELNNKMESLQRNVNLDLIIERTDGYSMIWVD